MNREKKQMMVLGALALMIVAVGAFQFMGSSAPEPAPAKVEAKADAESGKQEGEKLAVLNPKFSSPYSRRDPFSLAPFARPQQPAAPAATAEDPKPVKPALDTSRSTKTATTGKQWPAPFDQGGRIELPPAGTEKGTSKQHEPYEPPAPEFGYSLVGTIQGDKPAAVLSDSAGNQRLVAVGQHIDGDSVLVSVTGGKAIVRFNGGRQTLSIGDKR
jgi:hypothetical protein